MLAGALLNTNYKLVALFGTSILTKHSLVHHLGYGQDCQQSQTTLELSSLELVSHDIAVSCCACHKC